MAAFSIIAVGEVHSGHPLGGCPLGTLAQDVGGAGVHGISGSVYVITTLPKLARTVATRLALCPLLGHGGRIHAVGWHEK